MSETIKSLIIGMGEVGTALYNVLNPIYDVHTFDVKNPDNVLPEKDVYIMHVCIRYSEEFVRIVHEYRRRCDPHIINVCTTVPPGTCRELGLNVVHSTTRGLHPNLEDGLRKIKKHIGGDCAREVAEYFSVAGVKCVTHRLADTTELAHLLNNAAYGINLMFADEMARLCRIYGVDYYEAVQKYTETNNEGFAALDNATKQRMILTPPNGRIGGHCVKASAQLIPEEQRTPMLKMLAEYGDHN